MGCSSSGGRKEERRLLVAARAAADAEAAAAEEEEGDGDEPGGLFAAAGDAGSGCETGLLPSPVCWGSRNLQSVPILSFLHMPSWCVQDDCGGWISGLGRLRSVMFPWLVGTYILWLSSAKRDGDTPPMSLNPTQVADHH